MNAPPLLVICGQTGSGKGQAALQLAERLGAEIVLADSRKIYRGLDIGTAKPSAEQRGRVAYHLLDCCEPQENFSAARYAECADRAIDQIRARGKVPLVVGGTGLYIRTLLHGIVPTPPRDAALRARLEAEEGREPGVLHRRLEKLDPESARRIPPRDLVRTVRALEVLELSGVPISRHQAGHGFRRWRYRAWMVAPLWAREELYQRIERRVDFMLEAGWLDEVCGLLERGLENAPALKTLGYRELVRHLRGEFSFAQARERIRRDHRRYARRQGVWFRAEPGVEWRPAPLDPEHLLAEARAFLEKCS